MVKLKKINLTKKQKKNNQTMKITLKKIIYHNLGLKDVIKNKSNFNKKNKK
jgi:hypothetical protein